MNAQNLSEVIREHVNLLLDKRGMGDSWISSVKIIRHENEDKASLNLSVYPTTRFWTNRSLKIIHWRGVITGVFISAVAMTFVWAFINEI